MTKRKQAPVAPPDEFGDLAAAFANPTRASHPAPLSAAEDAPEAGPAADRAPPAAGAGDRGGLPPPVAPEAPAQAPQAIKRGRGRPRAEAELVNQTLSIRADQLRQLHQIAAAEYARLGRRVLPSEVVRVLLDRALAQLDPDEGLLG